MSIQLILIIIALLILLGGLPVPPVHLYDHGVPSVSAASVLLIVVIVLLLRG